MIPCVDFGHLYARSQGTELNDETAPADYAAILDAIAAALPGSGLCISTRIFPALPTPRAARSAI